jgi:prepilin-type N-terminal cleavage/methylation domain-containing protein
MVRGRSARVSAGYTLLELLFVVAIAGTLTTIAVPQGLRALDDFRTKTAARYLAQRLSDARITAIKRSTTVGLRFEAGSPDYRVSTVVDGNHNGLRTAEITHGTDLTITTAETLDTHFAGVAFGILIGVPDADGQPAGGSDGVRTGVSKLLSMNPDGTSSSGTLYVHGRDRSQYAVRVFGTTGRVRILKYDFALQRWTDL